MLPKSRVIKHFGTVAHAAAFFGIEVQSIYQWREEGIPRERELELMLRLPAHFRKDHLMSRKAGAKAARKEQRAA